MDVEKLSPIIAREERGVVPTGALSERDSHWPPCDKEACGLAKRALW